MKKKILLYGVSSYKNKGVEAIVDSTLRQIDKNKYDVTIASYDLPNNKKYYSDRVKYVEHYKKDKLNEEEKEQELKYQNMPFDYRNFELLYQNDVVKEIESSDICISVGGDNYCYDHCTWLYALDEKSKKEGKKTVLWGSSLYENIDDNIQLIDNLQNFDVVVIRESLTLKAIEKYVDSDKILYLPDTAFSLKPQRIKLDDWYRKNDFIVLNLSPLTVENDNTFQEILKFIDYLLNETSYNICLLPHVTTKSCNDLDILRKIRSKYKDNDRIYLEKNNYNYRQLKYIISKSKFAIIARTHASIAAYSTLIPTLVIGYSVKSRGIAKDIFGEYDKYVISKDELTSERIIEKFKYIYENKEKIIKMLSNNIPKMQEEASTVFDRLIEKISLQEEKTICEHTKCTGCGLCSNICPVKAITMEVDKEGFKYPVINLDKCIKCNKCRKICTINNVKETTFEKKCYAIKNKNNEVRKKSSSGGAFSIFASKFLKEHGVVYGCEMQAGNISKHIRIDNIKDLPRIRGSKYNQSDITEIFGILKKDLESGMEVLFSGTPCQINAIQQFLGKQYSNLTTISVVCHGVINDKILNKHIKSLEYQSNKKLTDWNFRTKNNDWNRASVSYQLGRTQKTVEFLDDNLMYLYLKNVLLRKSCYDCQFKSNNNISDIIIADYWGIEITNPKFFDKKGVSAILINSTKGEELFKNVDIEKYAYIEKGDYDDIYKYNVSIEKSAEKPLLRNISLSDLNNLSFDNIHKEIKLKILQKEYENVNKEKNRLKTEKDLLSDELKNIYTSKRWIVIDKIVNVINKIFRRKD